MRRLRSFILPMAVCLCTYASTETKPTYTALFELIWTTVNEHFYDPSFVGVDGNAVRIRYESRLKLVHNDREFIALMREMLHELRFRISACIRQKPKRRSA